jgi:hypothetical protein
VWRGPIDDEMPERVELMSERMAVMLRPKSGLGKGSPVADDAV